MRINIVVLVSGHLAVDKEVVAATAATRIDSLVVNSFLFLLSSRNSKTVYKDFCFYIKLKDFG